VWRRCAARRAGLAALSELCRNGTGPTRNSARSFFTPRDYDKKEGSTSRSDKTGRYTAAACTPVAAHQVRQQQKLDSLACASLSPPALRSSLLAMLRSHD